MRSNYIGTGIICRMLNRCKIINVILSWNNYYSAGMLTRSSLYTYAVSNQPVYLCPVYHHPPAFKILNYKTVCSLIGKRSERTCAKHIFRTEKLFCILMNTPLNLA